MRIHVARAGGFGRSSLATFGGLAGFRVTGDVARPDDSQTETQFRALQRAINDYIARHGLTISRIGTDGQIGPLTLAAYMAVAAHSPIVASDVLPMIGTVQGLADRAGELAIRVATLAGRAPDYTTPPSSGTSPTPPAPAPDGGGGGGGGSSKGKIIAGVLLGGVALWALTRKGDSELGYSRSSRVRLMNGRRRRRG